MDKKIVIRTHLVQMDAEYRLFQDYPWKIEYVWSYISFDREVN